MISKERKDDNELIADKRKKKKDKEIEPNCTLAMQQAIFLTRMGM